MMRAFRHNWDIRTGGTADTGERESTMLEITQAETQDVNEAVIKLNCSKWLKRWLLFAGVGYLCFAGIVILVSPNRAKGLIAMGYFGVF